MFLGLVWFIFLFWFLFIFVLRQKNCLNHSITNTYGQGSFAHMIRYSEINGPTHILNCSQNQTAYPVGTISQMQNPVAVNLMFTICQQTRLYLKIPDCDALSTREEVFLLLISLISLKLTDVKLSSPVAITSILQEEQLPQMAACLSNGKAELRSMAPPAVTKSIRPQERHHSATSLLH